MKKITKNLLEKLGQLQYEISLLGHDERETVGITVRTDELKDIINNIETSNNLDYLGYDSKKDKKYSFIVRDYETELVGRRNEEEGFFYVQRGDGFIQKYDIDRVSRFRELF